MPKDIHDVADLSTIGSFVLTVVLVYLAVRPPKMAVNSMPASGLSPPTSGRGRTVLLVLAVLTAIATVYQILYLVPKGIPGPPGPPGPRGAAAPRTPSIYEQYVESQIRKQFFDDEIPKLRKLRDAYEQATTKFGSEIIARFNCLHEPPLTQGTYRDPLGPHTDMVENPCRQGTLGYPDDTATHSIGRQINSFLSTMGKTINFDGKCDYDSNRPLPEEDEFKNASQTDKYDYRIKIDSLTCNMNKVDAEISGMEVKRSRAEAFMQQTIFQVGAATK